MAFRPTQNAPNKHDHDNRHRRVAPQLHPADRRGAGRAARPAMRTTSSSLSGATTLPRVTRAISSSTSGRAGRPIRSADGPLHEERRVERRARSACRAERHLVRARLRRR